MESLQFITVAMMVQYSKQRRKKKGRRAGGVPRVFVIHVHPQDLCYEMLRHFLVDEITYQFVWKNTQEISAKRNKKVFKNA